MTDDNLTERPRRGRPPILRQVMATDTSTSWWLGKDRAAFSAAAKAEQDRMAGSKSAKVLGYQEIWKTKGQTP